MKAFSLAIFAGVLATMFVREKFDHKWSSLETCLLPGGCDSFQSIYLEATFSEFVFAVKLLIPYFSGHSFGMLSHRLTSPGQQAFDPFCFASRRRQRGSNAKLEVRDTMLDTHNSLVAWQVHASKQTGEIKEVCGTTKNLGENSLIASSVFLEKPCKDEVSTSVEHGTMEKCDLWEADDYVCAQDCPHFPQLGLSHSRVW